MAEGQLPSTRVSGESGMSLLMDMANGFVNDVIQYKTIGKFMEENDINKFSDFDDIEWDEYVLFALGFAICAGIGILLAVIIPLSGCIVGCSQCCKCCCTCCGGRKRYQKSDHSRGEEYGCAASLLVMAGILLASVVCSYLATEMYRRELDPKTGALEDVLKAVDAMDTYIDDSLLELNSSVVEGIGETKLNVFDIIDAMPNATKDSLGMETNVKPPLDQLYSFTSQLQELSDALGAMGSESEELRVKLDELESNFTELRLTINETLFNNCPPVNHALCREMLDSLVDLTIVTDFTEVDDVAVGQAAVEVAKNSDVATLIGAGVLVFNGVAEKIDETLGTELESLKVEINEIERTVVKEVLEVAEEIRAIDLSPARDGIIEAKPYLEEYGHYVYAALISMNTIMLLVVVLLIIGVIVGLCCATPSKSTSSCDGTSIHGTNLLTAAVSFMFIFSWVLAIMLMVLFLGGGAVQSMGCRHIKTYDSSMEYLEKLLWVEIKSDSSLTYNISLHQAMLECQQDHSLYAAADVEANGFNISELLDLAQYGIYDIIDQIKETDIHLGELKILDDNVNATIVAVDSGLDTIDFTQYQAELDKDTTIINITEYGSQLQILANELNSDELREASDNLLYIGNVTIPEIELLKTSVRQHCGNATRIYPGPMTQSVNELAEGEEKLNADSGELLKEQLVINSDLVLATITDFTFDIETDIREDIGKCGVLFDAGAVAVYGACVYFLDPVNAIWFCYGWFLIFSIPAVILAVQLGIIFKTMAAVDPEYAALDYAGAEHYPLYYTPKGSTEPTGFHSNVVHPAYGEVLEQEDITGRESGTSEKSNKVLPSESMDNA
ncbi:hypothetical protein CAPTEDRAFT_216469, partial [Capitella teleta]